VQFTLAGSVITIVSYIHQMYWLENSMVWISKVIYSLKFHFTWINRFPLLASTVKAAHLPMKAVMRTCNPQLHRISTVRRQWALDIVQTIVWKIIAPFPLRIQSLAFQKKSPDAIIMLRALNSIRKENVGTMSLLIVRVILIATTGCLAVTLMVRDHLLFVVFKCSARNQNPTC
jgi:hypothetical protein